MWTNETVGSDVVVTPAYGGVEVSGVAILPVPRSWKVGRVSSKTTEAQNSSCAVWRQLEYPCPNAGIGILTVPPKGYGYSSRRKRTRCSLMDSHPVTQCHHLGRFGVTQYSTLTSCRPGQAVAVIRPTAAMVGSIFFVINRPRRVGRNSPVLGFRTFLATFTPHGSLPTTSSFDYGGQVPTT